jgi:hypothetical protein
MSAINTGRYESDLRTERHRPGINTGKIIAGGLLAGLVYAVLDFVTSVLVLGAENTANATRLGLDAAAFESPGFIASLILIDFLGGFLVVFIYAAIRPRFGSGPGTAVIAALLLYLNVAFVLFVLAESGVFPMSLYWKTAGLQLIVTVAGALAGARVYSER